MGVVPGRGRPLNFANVVSVIALFVALGGGAYAALSKNSVGPKQITKNAVRSSEIAKDAATGRDVKEASLGQVPSAATADRASSADIAASIADNAITGAKVADGQIAATDLAADEPFKQVGAGDAPFGNGGDGDCVWSDFGATSGQDIQPAAFYKDKLGRVHLAGVAIAANGSGGDGQCDATNASEAIQDFQAFTLPVGYRPDKITLLASADSNGSMPRLVLVGGDEVGSYAGVAVPPGAVVGFVNGPGSLVLEGLGFRAAS